MLKTLKVALGRLHGTLRFKPRLHHINWTELNY